MGRLLINGASLYVTEYSQGPAILGIHGTGSSAMLWEGAVAELSRRGRLILFDRRGCGRSERPKPYRFTSVGEHADDAASLLTALDAAPAIVIGRSYGGEVAVDLALRHPQVVRALVLLEPAMPMLAAELRQWLSDLRSELPAGSAPLDVAERLIAAALGPGAWEQFPAEVQQVFVGNGPAILAEVHGGWTQPNAASLARITQPVLLVSATSSPQPFRAADLALAQLMPAARFERVGGGHVVDPTTPVVLEFLDSILAGP